ncbi:MAG: type II toxin-antitoxin system HicB family antitoxin [Alphaproteobacteria bacterium]|nr:type II toxin-antitoxin system HicB family antitoxin [Alphaproteobacteria bacterium]
MLDTVLCERKPLYVALIEHDKGSLYGVRFPDLPGCYSAGKSAAEAAENAIEAVRLWAADALDSDESLPLARQLDELVADGDIKNALAQGAIAALVPLYLSIYLSIYLERGRTTRVNISLDVGTLAAIDDAADRRGLTRSGFVAEAAREKIGM